MEIAFNTNNYIKIKLTSVGEEIYREYYQDLPDWIGPPPLTKDDEGYSEFQLWEVMRIFGAGMYNGCNIPFETEIFLTFPDNRLSVVQEVEINIPRIK